MQKTIRKLPYIFVYICAFVLGMKQLREPDVWWQLLSGRWMLQHGQVTHTDVFSYTMAGRPWINVKWLYEILIALFEKAGGPESVILLQAIVNVLIAYLLIRTIKYMKGLADNELSVFSIAVPVLLFFAVNEYRMSGRPEMISHLMSVLYLFILWKNPSFEWKKIFWLVPLQCLWANMHEGYPVGMVIIGVYIAGSFVSYTISKQQQHLQVAIRAAAIFTAAALVILLNPNGIVLWEQPFEIYRQVWANKYTTELFSISQAGYWTIQAKWHIAILAIVSIFWILRIAELVKANKLKQSASPLFITNLLLIALFGYLSATANRNIPFSEILLIPSLVLMFNWVSSKLQLPERKALKPLMVNTALIAAILGAVFYISIVSNSFYKYTRSANRYGMHISLLHNPSGAAAFIKEHNIKGNSFSDYFVSSYLLWSLYPEYKSYIDLRDLDVFPVKFFDDYFSMYRDPGKFYDLDKKYHYNYIVLSTSQLTALQRELYWGEAFNLIYLDPVAAVYLRQSENNKYLNSDFSVQKLFNWPVAPDDPAYASVLTKLFNPANEYTDELETNSPVRAAKFYNLVSNYHTAIKILLPALYELGDNADALATMGTTYAEYASTVPVAEERIQKADSAVTFLDQAKAIDPKLPEIYTAMAKVNMIKGDMRSAIASYEQYVQLRKDNDIIYFMLGLCYRTMWQKGNNADDLHQYYSAITKAAKLNPDNPKVYLYIAEAELAGNNTEAAKANLKKAAAADNMLLPDEKKLMEELKNKTGSK